MNAQRGFAFIPLLIGAISIPVIGFFGFKYGDVLLVNSHVQQVKRAIAQQDIDAAIQTYLKHLENPAFLDRMGPLSEEVKYYMNYKRALEIYTTDSRPDYQYILGLLEGMPEDFAYRNKVISMREYSRQRLQNTQKSAVAGATTQRPAPQPPANKIDCTGPDGKHLQITQKECDSFNAAWTNHKQGQENRPPSDQWQNNRINIPSYTNTYVDNSITCFVSYPCTGASFTYRMLPSDCTYAQTRAAETCNLYPKTTASDLDNGSTFQINPDVFQAAEAITNQSNAWVQDMTNKYGGNSGLLPIPTPVPFTPSGSTCILCGSP